MAALLVAACSSSSPSARFLTIPESWLSTLRPARIEALSYDAGGVLLFRASERPSAISVERGSDGERLMNGSRPLTPFFAAIDSFDLSAERKEVVFSARRSDNFDVALVSADGSDIHWVPSDPVDEIGVQWAPRGNKVSYIVRTRSGDFIRTLHIPTSAQLTTDFPTGRVRALAWEPAAERFAVAWDSVDASSRVESMRYGGEERRIVSPPKVQLDVEVDLIGGVTVLRPSSLRYNDKLPLVVWITDDPNAWDDERAALQQAAKIACAVASRSPREAFWAAVDETPWIDRTHVFVVGDAEDDARRGRPAIHFVADGSVPAGHYSVEDNFVRAPAAVVESVAGGFIANQLKGLQTDQNVRPR